MLSAVACTLDGLLLACGGIAIWVQQVHSHAQTLRG